MRQLLVLLVLVGFTIPVGAADVSGVWTIYISWERLGGTHTTVCMLQQEDRQLTGSYWWGGGRYSVTGNRDTSGVSWSLDLDEDGFVIFEGRSTKTTCRFRARSRRTGAEAPSRQLGGRWSGETGREELTRLVPTP